ncbi:Hydroxyacid oxidase 1 [Chytriomyces hyalinus]|nr:Hydroxyacid oxidase 1 [Chytriomyces hyalinus]
MTTFVSVEDVRAEAVARMDTNTRNYYESGSMSQNTLAHNSADFSRILLRPRVLRDVSSVSLAARMLGDHVSAPLAFAPSAMHGLVCQDAEAATAKAASKTGSLMVLSSYSNTSLEDVKSNCPHAPLWIQLYVHKDRSIAEGLMKRAEAAGYKAVVLTVDAPVLGRRLNDLRNKFTMPSHLKLANFSPEQGVASQSARISNPDSAYVKQAVNKGAVADASLSWKDISWIRSVTNMKIVLKGIMTPEDAVLACEWKVDAIVVSNHGGRQLDTTPSTISVLPGIKAAVDAYYASGNSTSTSGRIEIYMDGGIRCGTDILKALALGANAVFIGRPVLWGLAVDGAAGVEKVVEILHDEMRNGMALLGVTQVDQLNPSCVQLKSLL